MRNLRAAALASETYVQKIVVEYEAPDIVEVAFRGNISGADVEEAVRGVKNCLRVHRARFYILDGTETEKYSTDVRGPGAELLRVMKDAGIEAGVLVTPSAPIRMMASVVAVVASVRMDFVANREEALAKIQRRRTELRTTHSTK